MANHRDPTAEAAVGAANREWKEMIRKAIVLRKTGWELTPEEERQFTGIYRRLLEDPEAELEKLLKGA